MGFEGKRERENIQALSTMPYINSAEIHGLHVESSFDFPVFYLRGGKCDHRKANVFFAKSLRRQIAIFILRLNICRVIKMLMPRLKCHQASPVRIAFRASPDPIIGHDACDAYAGRQHDAAPAESVSIAVTLPRKLIPQPYLHTWVSLYHEQRSLVLLPCRKSLAFKPALYSIYPYTTWTLTLYLTSLPCHTGRTIRHIRRGGTV